MQDTKLFETILGITTPWHVAGVELKTGGLTCGWSMSQRAGAVRMRRRVARLRPCRGTHLAPSRHGVPEAG